MNKIIIVGYLSGIIYELLCTDTIKLFASGGKMILDGVMENAPINESTIKLLKLVADLYMFVVMIIFIILWPIMLLRDLVIKIKNKYWMFRFKRKLKKLSKILEKIENRQ